MTELQPLSTHLRERFPEVELDVADGIGAEVITVPAENVVGVLEVLRDERGFEMLTDMTAVDWLPREPRYDVHYQLLSLKHRRRLTVKVQLPDDDEPRVPSATGLWKGANWLEREIYDFFGIVFTGHPDLKRILMPDEWIGHPLRKDYPVGGVPVEYRIEPAYIGDNIVTTEARPAAGGVPARLRKDRGRLSGWTWTGAPASGVKPREPVEAHEMSEEGTES